MKKKVFFMWSLICFCCVKVYSQDKLLLYIEVPDSILSIKKNDCKYTYWPINDTITIDEKIRKSWSDTSLVFYKEKKGVLTKSFLYFFESKDDSLVSFLLNEAMVCRDKTFYNDKGNAFVAVYIIGKNRKKTLSDVSGFFKYFLPPTKL